jgi:hypothetical protein
VNLADSREKLGREDGYLEKDASRNPPENLEERSQKMLGNDAVAG